MVPLPLQLNDICHTQVGTIINNFHFIRGTTIKCQQPSKCIRSVQINFDFLKCNYFGKYWTVWSRWAFSFVQSITLKCTYLFSNMNLGGHLLVGSCCYSRERLGFMWAIQQSRHRPASGIDWHLSTDTVLVEATPCSSGSPGLIAYTSSILGESLRRPLLQGILPIACAYLLLNAKWQTWLCSVTPHC